MAVESEILDRFTRSRWIFGEKFSALQNAKVLVCGCGGVGGACIEALYRSGVVGLIVIDADSFDITNQNRQFGSESLNEKKAEVFARKFAGVRGICARIDAEFLREFDVSEFDFVVDAIDDVPAKILLAKACAEAKIPFISAMGGAKRLDPTKLKFCSIWQTSGDPFARKIRTELKKASFVGDYTVLCSTEPARTKSMGSFMGVTACCGLFIASFVVRELIK